MDETQRARFLTKLLLEACDAFEEIEKGEGAFSRDQLTHASNTIENMRGIANRTRVKILEKLQFSFKEKERTDT